MLGACSRHLRRVALALLLAPLGALAQAPPPKPAEAATKAGVAGVLPTRDALNTRIEQVNALKDVDAAAKTRLLELYRKALAGVESVQASTQAAERFRRAAQDAPAEVARIRDALSQPQPAAKPPPVPADAPLADLEQRLQKQKADLAVLESQVADLQKAVSDTDSRPAAARQRLADA